MENSSYNSFISPIVRLSVWFIEMKLLLIGSGDLILLFSRLMNMFSGPL